ncbi:MAG: FkbM family methyltransferase [Rhizobacter sp.]|nr:FkbM family methyltransferase [Chlorobiales bacterium]
MSKISQSAGTVIKKLLASTGRRFRDEYREASWQWNQRQHASLDVETRQGKFTVYTKDDAIGRLLYLNREFERELMARAMNYLRTAAAAPPKGQGTLLDIGANMGITSVSMIHAGEVGHVIAIEPEPDNFKLLEQNVKQNGFENRITCLPYAAADESGELLFELSEWNFGDHRVRQATGVAALQNENARDVIRVKAERLDTLLSELPKAQTDAISAIWIDVQGYEGHVFKGAERLLAKGIPVVSELWPYGIARAGMSQAEFCRIAATYWKTYSVLRRGRFMRYPIEMLHYYFEEIGSSGAEDEYDNIIFI